MTQEKIAKALNMSRRTVARALNGDPKISKKTREAVLKYCASVGYKKKPRGQPARVPAKDGKCVSSDFDERKIFFTNRRRHF